MSNPYQSPNDTNAEMQGIDRPAADSGLSDDARGNIGLTTNIIKVASILAGLVSLVPVLQVWFSFRWYGLPNGWTWWHTLICYRLAYTPCWWLLASMMWKYAKSLNRLAKGGTQEIEDVIEQQTKMWLAGGLLAFVMLIGVALAYGVSMATQPDV